MKKIFLSTSVALLVYATNINAQTAYFTGAEDWDWHNPANWNWDEGSGIPDEHTAVILNTIAAVEAGTTAKAKSITMFTSDAGVFLLDDATLFLSGDVSNTKIVSFNSLDGTFSNQSQIIFNGLEDQVISASSIIAGDFIVDKASGDVRIPFSSIIVFDTLKLLSTPQELGNEAIGNIIVETRNVLLSPEGGVLIAEHTATQVPPHIVIEQPGHWETGMSLVWAAKFDAEMNPMGIDGSVFFPLGHTKKSYTPISISQEGEGTNIWSIHISNSPNYGCNDEVILEQSLAYSWEIPPVEFVDMGDDIIVPEVKRTVDVPADISISFNQNNIGEEIPEGYNPDLARKLFMRNNPACGVDDDISISGSTVITVTKHNATLMGEWGVCITV